MYCDHKPLMYAFDKISEKSSPRVITQLDFIGQFTTNIRYVQGVENIPADVLSRINVNVISTFSLTDYEEMSKEQEKDDELKDLLINSKSLNLKKINIPGSNVSLYCDVSEKSCRPYVPLEFRKNFFDMLPNLSHPGANSTAKLVCKRFVWPNVNKNCREWARACINCQRSKVTRKIRTPLGEFEPTSRFHHVHLDIVGPLKPSNGHEYLVTMIDRETRWPECIPTKSITAEAVADIFIRHWVSRFGAPARLTTDQGRQFESRLFKEMTRRLGIGKIRTTAYHPCSKGKIERWHRTLKAAIMAYSNSNNWFSFLPMILLGIRSAINSDLKVSAAQLTLGCELRLPGKFFDKSEDKPIDDPIAFVKTLSEALRTFSRVSHRHGASPVYVPSSMKTCSHVFVQNKCKTT